MMHGKIASDELAEDLAGSHKMVKMCAKWDYTYKNKEGKNISRTTNPERCGDSYRAGHSKEAQNNAKRSREQACAAAEQDLPTLAEGEEWVEKACKDYQQKG